MVGQVYGNANKPTVEVNATFVEDDNFIFYYQIDLDDPKSLDDRIFLKSEDGSYDEKIDVKKLTEEDGWVKLVFPEPKDSSAKLTMTYDKGDENEIFTIFEDEVYKDMLEAQEEEVL